MEPLEPPWERLKKMKEKASLLLHAIRHLSYALNKLVGPAFANPLSKPKNQPSETKSWHTKSQQMITW